MQDMDEMVVRAALRRVVAADEPPVGALVGEALRAGLYVGAEKLRPPKNPF